LNAIVILKIHFGSMIADDRKDDRVFCDALRLQLENRDLSSDQHRSALAQKLAPDFAGANVIHQRHERDFDVDDNPKMSPTSATSAKDFFMFVNLRG
jgi:hypothetical protein